MRRMPRVSTRLLLLTLPACWLAGCAGEGDPEGAGAEGQRRPSVVGTLQSRAIVEASGLAWSRRSAGALWVINDGGEEPVLHAAGPEGAALGAVRVEGAENRDWEDLAAFALDGAPWLLIADIGDNGGVRDHLTLYVVPEPAVSDALVRPAWTIRYTYPDGPHDAEAVAVDADAGRVYVLTKRTEPAELHAVPLRPDPAAGVIESEKLAGVTSLPARDAAEGLTAAVPYHWQPTGMDMAADGGGLVILTYADVYYYARRPGEPWTDTLSRAPRALGMPLVPVAEGIAFDDRARSLYVTAEGRHAPLLRFDLPAGPPGRND